MQPLTKGQRVALPFMALAVGLWIALKGVLAGLLMFLGGVIGAFNEKVGHRFIDMAENILVSMV